MTWKGIDLHGGGNIAKVCAEYQIEADRRVDGGVYRVKVLENARGGFVGYPNFRLRNLEGKVDGTCGFGASELDALEDAIRSVGVELDKLQGDARPERFVWSD